jgi:5-methylthioadenosine/S-adenosylhomocysteine deaminase
MDSDPSLPANMRMTTGEALKANEALVKRWRNHDTIKAWLAVRQIVVATEELQRGIGALAKELDTRVHTHLAEGTYEVDFALARWGMRPAEYLDHLGVFNDRLHTAHAVLLSMDEMDLYAERGVSACHCAFNNYTLGRPRALEMWRRGIPIGIGSDGAAVFGPLDLFRLVHIARVGQQSIEGTPNHARDITSTQEMMTMALRGGARAAGMAEELGCIAPGRLADIILVSCDDPDQGPDAHPGFTVANNVVGRDVRTVIINGRVVMRDREFLTIDIEAARAKVGSHAKDLMGRYDAIVS